tara:strand:- start:471 stop:1112 length:642 start_codon:yes stop_codon:yes gene_type:complete
MDKNKKNDTEEQEKTFRDRENKDLDTGVKNEEENSEEAEELEKKTEEADNENSQENELREELESIKDEKLRLLAEMENLRKRSERDKSDSIRYGSMNLAREILSVNDNLSRALQSVKLEDNNFEPINNLVDGLNMVQKEFMTILNKYGVEKIDALNKKFDHNFHQAVLEVENAESEEGVVVQEIQAGFTMYDRLLRPSMVGVSKKPKNDEKEE